mgnify:CR=1 FL=1
MLLVIRMPNSVTVNRDACISIQYRHVNFVNQILKLGHNYFFYEKKEETFRVQGTSRRINIKIKFKFN